MEIPTYSGMTVRALALSVVLVLGLAASAGAQAVGGLTGAATSADPHTGGSLAQKQELTASDGAPGDEFGGGVVSGDGHVALVGALSKNGNKGAAYVFTKHAGTWTPQQELTASDGVPGDYFGSSVALSNDGHVEVIGAFGKNGFTGAVYVFTEHGGTWTQQHELTASGGTPLDSFGQAVALSKDGHVALIGTPGKDGNKGAAYVFTEHAGAFSQQQELTASDGVPGDAFGSSVGLSNTGHVALIGAPTKNAVRGAAYVFS